MRAIVRGAQFKRDVKLVERRGKDLAKLRELICCSLKDRRYQDHPLSGAWKHHRDSHIEPDWLLLYKIDGNNLYLVRTGTHADLF